MKKDKQRKKDGIGADVAEIVKQGGATLDKNGEAVSVLIDRIAPDGQKIKTAEQIREQNPEDCELLAIGNDGKQYSASYNQKLKSIFFAIPRSVKIIGYIGA